MKSSLWALSAALVPRPEALTMPAPIKPSFPKSVKALVLTIFIASHTYRAANCLVSDLLCITPEIL